MIVIILFFIYGLAFGSFCNVVITRLHSDESIFAKNSHCPRCKKDILWRDNIPVASFFLLGGKCRNCKEKISWQYPVVEIMTGILFALISYFYIYGSIENLVVAVLYSFAFACLVVVFVYDMKYMEIPMSAMWLSIGIICVTNIIIDSEVGVLQNDFFHSATFMHSISALVAFCFFFALSYISDERWMGYGDAFVAVIVGLFLGPVNTFLAFLVAFCVGALWGVGIMIIKDKTLKTAIPFGPFLLFGLLIIFITQNLFPHFLEIF